MKVAIVFSGDCRNFDKTKNYWLELKNKYNADVFASFWDNNEKEIKDFVNIIKPIFIDLENKKIVKKTIIDQLMNEVGNFNILNKNERKSVKDGNILYMSYKIWKANSLTKLSDKKYDVIIRARTDVDLDRMLEVNINDYFNLPKGLVQIKDIKNNWGFTDVLSYSNPDIMDYYSSFLFYYLKYIKEGHFAWSPEYLFRIHLNNKNIKVRLFFSYINIYRMDQIDIFNRFIQNQNNDDVIMNLNQNEIKVDERFYCYLNNNMIYKDDI